MARPKNQELAESADAFKSLKPLPRYYGLRVSDHYPEIDLPKLYQAVAGRTVYEDGLIALRQIKKLYSTQPQKQTA